MIDHLSLKNFRKFSNFGVRLQQGNIFVGPNNSGKSSILDAFRILDACYRYARRRSPELIEIAGTGVVYGYQVPESILPFSIANITTNYSDEDAILEFRFSKKTRAIVRLHPDRLTRFYVDAEGQKTNTSSQFRRILNLEAVIVPTLAPLEAEEAYVQDETVRRNASTRLASRVLRNIWLRENEEEFKKFATEIEAAWAGVELSKPEMSKLHPPTVQMFYTENRLTREVQWAGFGFQVWLQLHTHLRRGGKSSVLVIDEPDIYLHPDLQRRLLRTIRARFGQFIVATHAVEIVNDAHASEIVSINPKSRSGLRIRTEDEYATLYKYLGAADNADLARIARARKVIFVEGRDGKLLRRLALRFGYKDLADPQGPPVIQLGGFSNSPKAAHAIWAFRQVLDMDVVGYCLFDRDYRSEDQVNKFLIDMTAEGMKTRVLGRKEIENYLLVEEALHKSVCSRLREKQFKGKEPTVGEISSWLLEVAETEKSRVNSQRAAHILQFAKETGSRINQSTLLEEAIVRFEDEWKNPSNRLKRVSGKELFSKFNALIQERFKISITEARIIENLTIDSLGEEFAGILSELDDFCRA